MSILRGIHTQYVAILWLVWWRGGHRHCWLGEWLDVLVWWVVMAANALGLDEWYTVCAMFVTNANEDWFTPAGDEDTCLFVDGDAILCEDGNGALIGGFTDTHAGSRKVIK